MSWKAPASAPTSSRDSTGGSGASRSPRAIWSALVAQGPERARQPAGQDHDHESQQEKATEREQALHGPQPGDLVEQLVLGVEGRERPPRTAERSVGEAERRALELDPGEARLPGQHPLHDRLEPRTVLGFHLLEDGPRGRRLAPVRGGDHDPRPREHEPEAAPAQLDPLHDRVQPPQSHVRRHDPGRRAACAAERDGEGDHRGLPRALVLVRLGPHGPSRRDRFLEPGAVPVPVGLRSQVGGLEATLALRRPVVVQGAVLPPGARHPRDRGAVEVAVALDEAPQQRVDVAVAGAEDGERLAERERPLLDRVQQVLDPAHRRLGLVDRLTLGGGYRHPAGDRVGHRDRHEIHAADREERPEDESRGEAAEAAGREIAGNGHRVAGISSSIAAPPIVLADRPHPPKQSN